MKNLNPTNSDYLLKAGHDLIFQEILEWKSELQFYVQEMKFFKKLLDKTFLRVTTKSETENLERFSKQLGQSLELRCASLLEIVMKHETKLGKLEESAYIQSDEILFNEHKELKVLIGNFRKEMKIFKSDLFENVEEIIHISKMATKGFEEGSIVL